MFSLGLGLPIHRIPIMTILLAIFCTWKYISIDVSNNKKFEKKHQQIAKKINQSQEQDQSINHKKTKARARQH